MNETLRKMADVLQCKYTLFKKETDPEPVEQAYKKAVEAGKAEGFYAAIVLMEGYGVEGLEYAAGEDYDKEHFAFCSDRVYKGTRTYKLSELAAGLAGSDVWYFWWD